MEIKLKDFIEKEKIVAFVNVPTSFSNLKSNKKIAYVLANAYRQNIGVKKYLEKKFVSFSQEKFQKACQMVLLNPDILKSNLLHLSFTEVKKLRFVEALLYNSETILFENFEQGFFARNRSYYQKLFLKLTQYGKCICVFSNDISFLMGMTKQFYLYTKQNYLLIHDFYDNRIYDYVEMPPIISYIKYLHSKNIQVQPYLEMKELLKGIYRNVTSGADL